MRGDVLIADQDAALAKLYCRFLCSRGLSADLASDGLECLRMVRDRGPHVLVLDCELPWGDGAGVLACLREDGLSLPVILTTWKDAPEARLLAPPVVRCLRKFFPLPALLDAVDSVLAAQVV